MSGISSPVEAASHRDDDEQALNAAQIIHDSAIASAGPELLDTDDSLAAFTVPAGCELHLVDVTKELAEHQAGPARKTGKFVVHDADSFVAYTMKHVHLNSEVWADVLTQQIIGVLNAHDEAPAPDGLEGQAGWGDHRVVYKVDHTDAWKAWAGNDGKLLEQQAFSEFIEDNLPDIVEPFAADLLELVQTFQATTSVEFESSQLLSNGQRRLKYKETTSATAGKNGEFEIPKELKLAIKPFEGADLFGVTARFRFRLTNGHLHIGYKLDRPEDVIRAAFESVVEQVQEGVSAPVYRGVSG